MTHKTGLKSLEDLLEVMRVLRAPGGCPWDAEQTPEKLTPYIIEEACELVDAIEDGNLELIRDELGDLLLQVVFQAQIFSERAQFDFHDIAQGIADKLIRRHPHVFADESDCSSRVDLDRQWEDIKKNESTNNKNCFADHLPSKLPALQLTQKLISRAYKAGRQGELPDDFANLAERLNADQDSLPAEMNEEVIGLLLFRLVDMAHAAGVDAESSLRRISKKLVRNMDNE